jgi:SNF2 family DNA or RNA helicase
MVYKTKPYKHQQEGFDFFKGKEFGAIFTEQGTGKSKIAIDISANLFLEKKINAVLVIAPNTIHSQWSSEQIPTHSPVKNKIFVWKTARGKKYKRDLEYFCKEESKLLKWFCVNVEAFSTKNNLAVFRDFVTNNKTLIILDEATAIKNPKSNRSFNIIYELGDFVQRRKQVISSCPGSLYRFILTGTMVTNSPYDLWSMFEFLKKDYFKMSYYSFRSYFGLERQDYVRETSKRFYRKLSVKEIEQIKKLIKNGFGFEYISNTFGVSSSNIEYIGNNPDINTPYKNMHVLKKTIQKDSFIVRKKDCLDLPDKVYKTIPVELTKEQRKVYKEMQKNCLAVYGNKVLTAKTKLAVLVRLSQIVGGFFPYDLEAANFKNSVEAFKTNPKLNTLIHSLYETDERLIIFARFVAEIEMIITAIKKNFPDKRISGYYGAVSAENREQIKNSFQREEIDILIGNARCAGVGLNLQVASSVYYFSNDYSLYYREQSEDRIHRIGLKNTAVYTDLIAVNTIDEKIYKCLREHKDLLEFFRDHSLEDFIGGY